jgi:hypothetical protein
MPGKTVTCRGVPEAVTWLGMSAVYSPLERTILAQLPLREQTFLHALKSLTEGEIEDSGPVIPSDKRLPATVTGVSQEHPSVGPVYTEPDDIPFGDVEPSRGPRKRPTYALVWTWRRRKVTKTKAAATSKMRTWKRWYERQGWKVTNHAEGYFARHPSGELHAITLHEYDAKTGERLK